MSQPDITLELIDLVRRHEEDKWLGSYEFQHGMLVGEKIFNKRIEDQREVFDAVSDALILGEIYPLGNVFNKNWEQYP